jgi:primary-amine oxidase
MNQLPNFSTFPMTARQPAQRRYRQGIISVLAIGILLVVWMQWQQRSGWLAHAFAGACPAGSAASHTFTNGARWDLCWRTDAAEGIVLSEIHYQAPGAESRKVLREASLSQIEVLYDDGLATNYYTSEPGLGGAQLLSLTADDCPNGTLLSQGTATVLCQQSGARGYLYKYYTAQRQGEAWILFSASQIGQRLYIVKWRFVDDGTIEPQVGDGGRLLRQGRDERVGWPVTAGDAIGIGYLTNFWWRLDFDLAGNGANDFVDEFVVTPQLDSNGNDTGRRITRVTQLDSEGGRATDPDVKRSWRVRDGALRNSDGHAISYQLEPKTAGYRYAGSTGEPWDQYDFYVTVAQACERLASRNPECGANVADFANNESIAGADVVIWHRITAHRLPRAEDTPLLSVNWYGFQLLPRDWTAQNPF